MLCLLSPPLSSHFCCCLLPRIGCHRLMPISSFHTPSGPPNASPPPANKPIISGEPALLRDLAAIVFGLLANKVLPSLMLLSIRFMVSGVKNKSDSYLLSILGKVNLLVVVSCIGLSDSSCRCCCWAANRYRHICLTSLEPFKRSQSTWRMFDTALDIGSIGLA